MKTMIALTLLMLLAACAGLGQVQQKLQALTVADVQAALATANAAQDQDGIDCYTALLPWARSMPSGEQAAPVGVLSALENARVLRLTFTTGVPPAVHKACAALVVDENTLLLKLGLSALPVLKP
jgi:hypothetical protein